MSQQKPITDRILEFLRGSPECDFEALVTRYPEFSWNELYLEVSRLTKKKGSGVFFRNHFAARGGPARSASPRPCRPHRSSHHTPR